MIEDKQFNYIYSKLVSDDTDILGHIAYSLYKGEKVEYLEKLARKKDADTHKALDHFHQISCLDSTLERYKLQAQTILLDYLNEVLKNADQAYEHICKSNITHASSELASVIHHVQ